MTKATNGKTVKVHYTGKLENGDIFDSSREREPLEFTIGQGQMIPGFEKGIMDMAVGDKKTIVLPPEEAYGEYNEELTMPYKRSDLPADLVPQVGMTLQFQSQQGQVFYVTVIKVTDDEIVVDANHQLAGKTLTFDVEMMEIS
jgi:FKBP-type peptidyl-prolyl cis-trans isomerase 2